MSEDYMGDWQLYGYLTQNKKVYLSKRIRRKDAADLNGCNLTENAGRFLEMEVHPTLPAPPGPHKVILSQW